MSSTLSEPTFSKYTPADSQIYAQHRQDYNPKLYSLLLTHHTSTGGSLTTLLDIGCGPGTAARALSPHFKHTWALDPSEGMIATARQLGGRTCTGEEIRFEVCPAETLAHVPSRSVDLIISAAAAHWFNMPLFWRAAARVLKPGGTVALWSGGSMRPDPEVFEDHKEAGAALQRAVDEFEEEVDEFLEEGNRVNRGLYEELGMPWEEKGGARAEGSVEGVFDREGFRRVEWGTGRKGSLPMREFHKTSLGLNGGGDGSGDGGLEEGKVSLDVTEMALGTTSFVTRWREANPQLAGTEKDVVKRFRAKVGMALADAGMSTENVRGGMTGFMLLLKIKAKEQA